MASTEGTHAAAAASQLFAVLGEAVVHWPAGVEAAAATVTALVDRTEQTAEAAVLESNNGNRQIPLRAILTLAASVVVTVGNEPVNNSRFVFHGQTWYAERIVLVEQSVQEVVVRRMVTVHTARQRSL